MQVELIKCKVLAVLRWKLRPVSVLFLPEVVERYLNKEFCVDGCKCVCGIKGLYGILLYG